MIKISDQNEDKIEKFSPRLMSVGRSELENAHKSKTPEI
jgi:hypothetical protein